RTGSVRPVPHLDRRAPPPLLGEGRRRRRLPAGPRGRSPRPAVVPGAAPAGPRRGRQAGRLMHESVLAWVAGQVHARGLAALDVIELGSYDVNGSVRPLFVGDYTGIDMRPGPGV